MRRLAHHLRRLPSVLSLLLAVAAAGMWVRSYFAGDSVPRLVEANAIQLHSARGRLVVLSTYDEYPKPGRLIEVRWLKIGDERVPLPGIDLALRERLRAERGTLKSQQFTIRTSPAALANGFGFDVDVRTTSGGWYVVVPYWAVVALLLVIPAFTFGGRARRRRRERRRAAAAAPTSDPATETGSGPAGVPPSGKPT